MRNPKPGRAAAQSRLLSIFSRVALDGIATDAGIPNSTWMTRPDLEAYLLANWPDDVMRERLVRLAASAAGEERIGTHGPGCWSWGTRHYECALAEIERLKR